MILFIRKAEIVRKNIDSIRNVHLRAGNVLFQCVLQMRRLNSVSVPGINNAHVNQPLLFSSLSCHSITVNLGSVKF